MKYKFSFFTSLLVVFIFSLSEVRRMDCVLVEADRVLRTPRGCPKKNNYQIIISGSGIIEKKFRQI